ncbi:MAG: hypothetical protein ABIS51_22110 [Sphingomonas sp.]
MLVADRSLLAKTSFLPVLRDIKLRRTRSRALLRLLRLVIALSFVGSGAAAAYHAALGLFSHLIAYGAPREALALAAAFLVGSAAWRRFTDRGDLLPAVCLGRFRWAGMVQTDPADRQSRVRVSDAFNGAVATSPQSWESQWSAPENQAGPFSTIFGRCRLRGAILPHGLVDG